MNRLLRRGRPIHLFEIGVRWPPETFIGWKLEGLAQRGMRVTLATRSVSVWDPDVRLQGVELVVIPPQRTGVLAVTRASIGLLVRSPRRLLKLVRGIRRAPAELHKRHGGTLGLLALCLPLARFRPDVVHFEWHSVAVDYLPLFDVWGCPVVTSCRGSDTAVYPHIPGRDHYTVGLPEVLSRVSASHCVSDSQAREAVDLGLDPAKARVIKPGDDPALFRPATDSDHSSRAEDGDLRVVSVGWLRWEKGHEYALQAIRMLLDSEVPVRLEMIGGVPEEWQGKSGERERILHTLADLGLEGHVHLNGHAPSSQVVRRLQASDVFLHASVTEGIPNAIIEAMACGLPVVAARCGGIPEAITDGVEGFLAASRQPEDLAAAISRLWRDPELRQRMGAAGQAKFMSEFTLEREHEALMAMYRELAGA